MLFSQLSPREAPLAFNHAFHIEQGLECADCHAGVESGAEPGMPTSPQCMLCHENQDRDKPPEKKVSSLFVDQVFQAKHFSRLPNEVIFSHASHLARGQECAACHGEVASSHRVEAAVGVTMEECLACHASKGPSDDCANCHRETRKDQKPPTHDLAWRKTHGKVVRAHSVKRTDRCSLCHSESTCTSCHSDDERSRMEP